MVAKAGEDVVELGLLHLALDLAQHMLESEQKSKEEAEGLAAALARDVGVLQREKMVLEEQVKGVVLVTFFIDVPSQFSDAL